CRTGAFQGNERTLGEFHVVVGSRDVVDDHGNGPAVVKPRKGIPSGLSATGWQGRGERSASLLPHLLR
ncbi:MAG: hypothetical protein PHS90_07965, partial [Synergistaceae bacterium]|nr:hypothetical protein [Synergistaceae bacterium]